jgi:hydroxypyruvate reductase
MDRSPRDGERLLFLSAGTDGIDGPTDAAGAWADLERGLSARAAGLDLEAFLADNDSYGFFSAVGGLLKTGPTNTNVCDIQVLLLR